MLKLKKNGAYRVAIITAIVVLCLLGTSLAFAITYGKGITSHSTPTLTTLFGLIASAIGALVALLRVDQVNNKADSINLKVNGHLQQIIDALLNAGVKPQDLPPTSSEIITPMEAPKTPPT